MAVGTYIPRVIDAELRQLLAEEPAVCIEGPRASGKTTTARQFASSEFNLDNGRIVSLIKGSPERIVDAPEPILIDEWQRVPEVWDVVRRAVDDNRSPGRFILTGSAAPKNPPTHTGAGRILKVRMRPMSLGERWVGQRDSSVSLGGLLGRKSADPLPEIKGETDITLEDYLHEVVTGGFPGMRTGGVQHRLGQPSRHLKGYCEAIVDTDFPAAEIIVRSRSALFGWLEAYAAATSTATSYEKIRDAAVTDKGSKPAKTTVAPYRDALAQMWVADPVEAWLPTRSRIGRLTQSPKHHLADPALAASLQGVDAASLVALLSADGDPLLDPTLPGRLFESLMALSLRVYAQAAGAKVFHFRTKGGEKEVDFVIERPDGRVIAIETKLSADPDDSDYKHLRWLKEELGDRLLDAVMVTTGPFAYRRKDGIAVVPAALLGP